MQNSLIYGIAILFSLVVYLLFIMPLHFTDMLHHKPVMQIIILTFLLIFPLIIAWLLIIKGIIAFFLVLPFYLLSLTSLYRGFYISDQFSILKSMNIDFIGHESLIKLESVIIYILIAVIGIIVSLVLSKHMSEKE